MRQLKFKYLDPESILDCPDFRVVESFLKMTNRTETGWHYIVDLTWIYSHVKDWPRSYKIIDAGGGNGPTQFLLAELGFHVVNVDLFLQPPNLAKERRYGSSLTRLGSYRETGYVHHLAELKNVHLLKRKLVDIVRCSRLWNLISAYTYQSHHQAWRRFLNITQPVGKIDLIQANLSHMPEIEDDVFDAVVSLSSLEHIPTDSLVLALSELKRVLKPDARAAITTSATEADESWFHKPSKGNCFSDKDLTHLFEAHQDGAGSSAKEILGKYQRSGYLRNHLSAFYRSSGNNGMPWGEWNPRYIPVGLWR